MRTTTSSFTKYMHTTNLPYLDDMRVLYFSALRCEERDGQEIIAPICYSLTLAFISAVSSRQVSLYSELLQPFVRYLTSPLVY